MSSDPEFEKDCLMIDAAATSYEGISFAGTYGEGAAVSASPGHLPCGLSWSFETDRQCAYEIWALYAADDYRPMELAVDGQAITTAALGQKTGGWHEADQCWRYQAAVPLTAGSHVLSLRRFGVIPHIRRIALRPVVEGVASPTEAVQRYAEALHPQGADSARSELLRVASPFGDRIDPTIPFPTLVDFAALSPSAAATLSRLGIRLAILEAIGDDGIGFGASGGLGPTLSDSEARAEDIVARGTGAFRRPHYQAPFFQAGGLVTLDPFTGARLVSSHSFILDPLHIAYRFSGRETFYIVVGRIMGRVAFACFPRINIMVHYTIPGEHEGHRKWSIVVYRTMLRNILKWGAELVPILQSPRRGTAVVVGFWNNFGHYLWQDLAGLSEILELHGPSAVQQVVVGPHSKLALDELFPEIADRSFKRIPDLNSVFADTFQLPYQHLRPVSLLIKPDLRARVLRVCESRVPSVLQERMRQTERSRFTLWITLRSHNKSWARQAEGHAEVLNRLTTEVGPLAVILDGMPDTRPAASRLMQGLDSAIEVIDTIGCSIYESFLWARVAHLYSTVVSTGLFFNSYFASRPGVAHANPTHLLQVNYWSEVAPGTCPPTFLDPSDVTGNSELYGNYDFEPDLLYRRLRELIDRHYPERLRAPTIDVPEPI